MKTAPPVTIRPFQPSDAPAFAALNRAWIERYFRMEEEDYKVLLEPQANILDVGGAILIADSGVEPIGTCALVSAHVGEGLELVKMAVADAFQGHGIGRMLIEATLAEARTRGARRVYLETNRKLETAIRLYERCGFRHLAERLPTPFERADVQMEIWLA